MTITPTKLQLRKMLSNVECEGVYNLLVKHYQRCLTRQRDYEDTGIERYKDTFSDEQLNWLRKLLTAFPVQGKANRIPQIVQAMSDEELTTLLSQLHLSTPDIHKVKDFLSAQKLNYRKDVSDYEIERTLVQCRLISTCRLCEHAHYTNERDPVGMRFHGCIENQSINAPIFGECTLFYRRESDE